MAQRIVQPSLLLKCDQALVQDAGAAGFLSSLVLCICRNAAICSSNFQTRQQEVVGHIGNSEHASCMERHVLCSVSRALISSKVCFTGLMLVSCISARRIAAKL